MSENRKLINSSEQAKAINMMLKFKSIHDNITKLEVQIESIKEVKEVLLEDLDMARADDEYYQAQLEAIYGPGKLDTTTLEWVTKIEEHEDSENNS